MFVQCGGIFQQRKKNRNQIEMTHHEAAWQLWLKYRLKLALRTSAYMERRFIAAIRAQLQYFRWRRLVRSASRSGDSEGADS